MNLLERFLVVTVVTDVCIPHRNALNVRDNLEKGDTMRPPITNDHFDPKVMLEKALAGAYPAAATQPRSEKQRESREAEIAYWRARVATAQHAYRVRAALDALEGAV